MPSALAFANNDVAQIVWTYEAPIPGCLGFAVFRQAADGTETVLPTWVGFPGQTNPNWTRKDSTEWPVQEFSWRDLTAREQETASFLANRGATYTYRVVPVSGDPTSATPLTLHDNLAVTTNPVTLTPERGVFSTFFNRGILSTQWLARQLPQTAAGKPDSAVLMQDISTPGNPLRNALAGDLLTGLPMLLKRAASDDGTCYLALYELNDPELIAGLLAAPSLHLILSNTAPDDRENAPARQQLHAKFDGQGDSEVIDRFVPSGHIGHNKFCIYVDAGGTAQAVLLGSTNWTMTALCGQSNNALVVEDTTLANAYFDYWHRLKDDSASDGSKQGPALRNANAQPGATDVPVNDGTATVWFSPNTPHARSTSNKDNEATPPDLQNLFDLMNQAKQMILFLEFQPGKPSVIDQAAQALDNNPALFVRGATTDSQAPGEFITQLTNRGGAGDDVVSATAVNGPHADWETELLKSSDGAHAIIHDKIVVIDPMSPDCVVATGSHNQGFRASYNNDENLLIVKGHRPLAQAYATHVLDVYDHYRFRFNLARSSDQVFSALSPDDSWQKRFFDPNDPASKDLKVWF